MDLGNLDLFKLYLRSLWYIRLCLRGKIITGDRIADNNYNIIIYELIYFLFIKNNL